MSVNIRITEHTTTDDPYCVVENVDTGESGEWYGDAESFVTKVAKPKGMNVIETVWS